MKAYSTVEKPEALGIYKPINKFYPDTHMPHNGNINDT